MIINVIIYFVLYLLVMRVWDSYKERGQLIQLLAGLRPRHAGWGLLLLFTTVLTISLMSWIASTIAPWLQWSWFTALTDQSGSMLSAGSSGQHTVPKPALIALYASLVLAMPLLVMLEERMFRAGAERRTTRGNVAMACIFGMAHMVVGVPVFAAIALIPAGLWLTRIYRGAFAVTGSAEIALLEAGRAHLINNFIAVALGVAAYITVTQ